MIKFCNCKKVSAVARDMKSTCMKCGGIDAYKKSKLRGTIMTNEDLELKVNYAMNLIDAEDSDVANIRGIVERLIAAGFEKTETCDPAG